MVKQLQRLSTAVFHPVRMAVLVCEGVAALGIVTMMGITCVDVVLRTFSRPLTGALDMVMIAGAITIAGALPYTTAVKGHVAIEYFFQMLSRRWRLVVDTIVRLMVITLFGLLARQCVIYGLSLKQSGEVTATLQVPIFWVPWVLAGSCAVTCLVVLYNLLYPGKAMIKP